MNNDISNNTLKIEKLENFKSKIVEEIIKCNDEIDIIELNYLYINTIYKIYELNTFKKNTFKKSIAKI